MNVKKESLGKGIRALLEGIDSDLNDPRIAQSIDHSTRIPLDKIEINPFQPRADFNEESLQELAESIKIHGVIQPITLRAAGNNKYQLIAGERRLRASKLAGLKDIPAYVRKAGDQEMLEIALIENIQREDLNAMEIAINYKRLMDECSLTQEQLGHRLGKNRTTVTNYLRMLKLPPEIQKGIKEKKITMGHARAIISVDDPIAQLNIYKEIIAKDLSVRKVEEMVRALHQPLKKVKSAAETKLPLAYQKIQDRIASLVGTKVKVKKGKGASGEIIISYYSDDDLERILDILGK